jgi:hypothetical protein
MASSLRAADPRFANLVGARVLAVRGVPIEEAVQRILDVNPGVNDSDGLTWVRLYREIPEYLQVLGLADSADRLTLTIQGSSGLAETLTVPAVQYDNFSQIFLSSDGFKTPAGWSEPREAKSALWLSRRNEASWYEYNPSSRTGYLWINHAVVDPEHPDDPREDRYTKFLDNVFSYIRTNHIGRLIIDLHHNSGGEETMWQALVHQILRTPDLNLPGHLFVAVGRLTESAVVAWAARIEGETMALFVGEETSIFSELL